MELQDQHLHDDYECGATHDNCIHTPAGTCDRGGSHEGSHHCSACNGIF